MTKTEEKALHFLTALSGVYSGEEAIEFSDDLTEDFTAMLIAMKFLFDEITGSVDDLISFTHVLNKLAVQHIMGKNAPCAEEVEFDYTAEDE